MVQAEQPLSQDDPARRERDARFEEYVQELGTSPTTVLTYEDLLAVVRGYQVTVLGGYSGLDYEHPGILKAHIVNLVKRNGDKAIYILGGTSDGIGRAYSWIPEAAHEIGFSDIKTAGIVSRNAVEYGIARQDYIVFVDTPVDDWGVLEHGQSLMVDIAKQVGGEMIYFRGGAVSHVEIVEALSLGVPVTIYAGDGLEPNAGRVTKRLEKDPRYVTDGTEGFLSGSSSGGTVSSLTVVVVDRDGRIVP